MKITKFLRFAIAVCLVGLLTLTNLGNPQSAIAAINPSNNATESTAVEDFDRQIEYQLNEYNDRINNLAAFAEPSGAATRGKIDDAIAQIKTQIQAIEDSLNQWRSASGMAKREIRQLIAQAMDNLDESLNDAESSFAVIH